jgi:hypothetical protein
MRAKHISFNEAKLSNLELKTWPKQLLGSLPLELPFPGLSNQKIKNLK